MRLAVAAAPLHSYRPVQGVYRRESVAFSEFLVVGMWGYTLGLDREISIVHNIVIELLLYCRYDEIVVRNPIALNHASTLCTVLVHDAPIRQSAMGSA